MCGCYHIFLVFHLKFRYNFDWYKKIINYLLSWIKEYSYEDVN